MVYTSPSSSLKVKISKSSGSVLYSKQASPEPLADKGAIFSEEFWQSCAFATVILLIMLAVVFIKP